MSSPSSAQLSRFAQAQNEVLSRQRDRAQFQDAMVMMKEQEEASQATLRGYRESMADLQSRLGPAKDEVTFLIEPRSNRTDDSEPISFYLCLTSDLSLSRSLSRRLFDSIFNEDSFRSVSLCLHWSCSVCSLQVHQLRSASKQSMRGTPNGTPNRTPSHGRTPGTPGCRSCSKLKQVIRTMQEQDQRKDSLHTEAVENQIKMRADEVKQMMEVPPCFLYSIHLIWFALPLPLSP